MAAGCRLIMGIIPVCLALIIGGGLGTIAGFLGGRVNTVIMRATDVVFAFPSILLAVAIAGALGAGIANTLLALTVVLIPPLVRVTESVTTGCAVRLRRCRPRERRGRAHDCPQVHVLGNVWGLCWSTP
jgi:peptide/nickel transport system permease protein